MRKAPGFAITVVLLLSLGIGSVTAVFSLVNAVLLKPVPYPDPSSLVIPWNTPPAGFAVGGYEKTPWGPIQVQALEHETKTYRYLGAFKGSNFNLTGFGNPRMLEGALVSWGFFPALGVQPELGRSFAREEDAPGHEHEVILSDSLWRNQFHADPAILDRAIQLNGAAYTVVGVMPRGFGFPRANELPADFTFPEVTELWVPLALPAVTPRFAPSDLAVVGRLQPGVPPGQAQAAMNLFAERMDREMPAWKGWNGSRVTPLQSQVAGDSRKPLLLILSAVALVLLIVCFNVAGLLITRSFGRQREFTLRAALGAGRRRVLRQLLTESLLLAFAGGAIGMANSTAAIQLVKTFGPANLPRLQEARADFRVFAFAFAVTLVTGILFGLAPALGAARTNLVDSLKEGGQRSGTGTSHARLRSALVVAQVALALMLVVASGLLVRTFYQLLASDSGFHADHVLTFEVPLPSTQYPDRPAIARFYQTVLPSLRTIPGVGSAGVTESIPMGGAAEATSIHIVGRPLRKGERFPIVNYTVISPDLFSALGTPILRGRDVADSDVLSAPPVMIINRAMARQYWPNEDPIGKQVLVPSQRVPATIVGIVADVKHASLREVPGPEVFEPYTQNVVAFACTHAGGSAHKSCSCRRRGKRAPGNSPCRSRSPSGKSRHPGHPHRHRHGRRTLFHAARGFFRNVRAAAGGGWNLRRHLVFRRAAHARDRHSRSPRSATRRCLRHDDSPRPQALGLGHPHWHRCRTRNGKVLKQLSLWRHRDRPSDLCVGLSRARRDCHRSQSRAGTPRSFRQPRGRSPDRMKRT